MKSINSQKTRNEIGHLIFNIANNLEWANKVYLNINNKDFESESYHFSEYCFHLFRKDIINLSEDYGINYYQVDRIMQKVLSEKEEILKSVKESQIEWQNAKYKEVA